MIARRSFLSLVVGLPLIPLAVTTASTPAIGPTPQCYWMGSTGFYAFDGCQLKLIESPIMEVVWSEPQDFNSWVVPA